MPFNDTKYTKAHLMPFETNDDTFVLKKQRSIRGATVKMHIRAK